MHLTFSLCLTLFPHPFCRAAFQVHAFLSEHLEHTALSQRPHPGKPKLQHVGFFSLFPLFSHYVVFPAHLIPCGKVNYLCYTEVCISCLDLCECWMCIFKLFLYISTWMAHKHIHLRFKATKTELAFFFFSICSSMGFSKDKNTEVACHSLLQYFGPLM